MEAVKAPAWSPTPLSPPSSPSLFRSPRHVAPTYVYHKNSPYSLNEISLSIANGVTADTIEPILYPKLEKELKSLKKEMEEAKNAHSLACINKAINFMHRHANVNETVREVVPVVLEVEDCVDADVENELRGEGVIFYTAKRRSLIINGLKSIEKEAAAKRDYGLATKANNSIRRLTMQPIEKKTERLKTEKQEKLQKQLTSFLSQRRELYEKWQKALSEKLNEKETIVRKMTLKFERELDEFDSEKMPQNYHKDSARLLYLKDKIRRLVSMSNYDEAIVLQQEVDTLEKEEQIMSRENWDNERNQKRKLLKKRQNDSLVGCVSVIERQIAKIKSSAEYEISHCNASIERLEKQLNFSGRSSQRTFRVRSSGRFPSIGTASSARTFSSRSF